MRCLLLLMLFVVCGCEPQDSPAQKSKTNAGWGIELRTIEHDNHRFVVGNNQSGLSVLHHPDCLCLGPRLEK